MTAQKPGDWAEYKWLVPVYEGSQLHKPSYRQLVEWDLDHPHIGIYCDCKQSSPWLLGEFAVVSGDELAWVWSYGWVTGDGYWVALKSALTKGPDIWMDMDELLRCMRAWSRGDTAMQIVKRHQGSGDLLAKKLLDHHDHAWGSEHDAASPRCRRCGYSASMRTELVQEMLWRLWFAGIREIPLRSFDQARHAYAKRR